MLFLVQHTGWKYRINKNETFYYQWTFGYKELGNVFGMYVEKGRVEAGMRIQDWAFGVGARELDLRFIFSQTSRLLLHCKTVFYSLNFPCYSMVLYLWSCIFLCLEYLFSLPFLENTFLTLKMQFEIYFFCKSFPNPTNVELDVLWQSLVQYLPQKHLSVTLETQNRAAENWWSWRFSSLISNCGFDNLVRLFLMYKLRSQYERIENLDTHIHRHTHIYTHICLLAENIFKTLRGSFTSPSPSCTHTYVHAHRHRSIYQ